MKPFLLAATAFLIYVTIGCGREPTATQAASAAAPAPRTDVGLPRRGPGDLYNVCERIWCTMHTANFALDHFVKGHDGWILHAAGQGDIFVPRHREGGAGFPNATQAALNVCGSHIHPWLLERRPVAMKKTGYNATLGYPRSHFNKFGTRLAPCCLNGLGWSFLHSRAPRQFRFADLDVYQSLSGMGWQVPFPGHS